MCNTTYITEFKVTKSLLEYINESESMPLILLGGIDKDLQVNNIKELIIKDHPDFKDIELDILVKDNLVMARSNKIKHLLLLKGIKINHEPITQFVVIDGVKFSKSKDGKLLMYNLLIKN